MHPRTQDGNLQLEPEVGLICELQYDNSEVSSIIPKYFCAYNDATIRKDGASKISQKKNWGINTKGISNQWIELDSFDKDSVIDTYHIASFIKRDGIIHEYGNDSPVNTYNYIYEKLLDWIVEKLNYQKDSNPLEDMNSYLNQINKPSKIIISIGATSYTDYGENTYLEVGDEIFVFVYDSQTYSNDEIRDMASCSDIKDKKSFANCSYIHQKIII
jgi:hypothetical protein